MSSSERSCPAGGAAEGLTAYPADEDRVRQRMARAVVDAGSFSRPLKRCDIAKCQGMCCHDGVYVRETTALILEGIARQHADFLAGLGLKLPSRVIVEGSWPCEPGYLKTAVWPRALSQRVQGYPAHFRDTACMFLTPDARCALEVLSVHLSRHPWHYKPIDCWLYPIAFEDEEEVRLVLYSYETDPLRLPGFDGFVSQTFCGRTYPDGEPAWMVLREELRFLSRIGRRDLLSEVQGYSGVMRVPPS